MSLHPLERLLLVFTGLVVAYRIATDHWPVEIEVE